MNFQLKGYDRVQALYLIKKDIKKNGDRFGEKKRSLEKLKQIQKIKEIKIHFIVLKMKNIVIIKSHITH